MAEDLYDFLQRSIELRRRLAETQTPGLISAADMMTSALMTDGKILVRGDLVSEGIAETFRRQLANGYQIERPSLPCLRLDNGGGSAADQCGQMRAIASAGDVLLLIAGDDADPAAEALIKAAVEKSLGIVLVCRDSQQVLREAIGPDNLDFAFGSMSKAHLLENYLAVSLTLAALIDNKLFGSDL